jgi:hypothetical protein
MSVLVNAGVRRSQTQKISGARATVAWGLPTPVFVEHDFELHDWLLMSGEPASTLNEPVIARDGHPPPAPKTPEKFAAGQEAQFNDAEKEAGEPMDADEAELEHTAAEPTEPEANPSPEPEITETIPAEPRALIQQDGVVALPNPSPPTEPMDITPNVDDLLLPEPMENDETELAEEDEVDNRSPTTEEMEETGVRPRVLAPPGDHSEEELEW